MNPYFNNISGTSYMCSQSGTLNIYWVDVLANNAIFYFYGYSSSFWPLQTIKSANNPVYLRSFIPFCVGLVFYSPLIRSI